MISLTDIAFSYPGTTAPVFSGLTLRVGSGVLLAVVGPDGSGKTTLAKLLKGILKPMEGTIAGHCTFPERVAYVGGDPYDMIVGLSVEEDVVFGMENQALPPTEMETRLCDALRWTGLERLRYRLTHTLSGGEQQKLVLAGALAMRAQVLVLDEALSMLHGPVRTSIRALIRMLRHQFQMTVVEITNHPGDLLNADRIVALDNGTIRFEGTPVEFVSDPWGREWCISAGGTGGLAAALIGSGMVKDTTSCCGDLASSLLKNLLE